MEQFEFVLIVLACVSLSSVADRFVRRVSLPILQIAIGLVAAIVLPTINEVRIDSELFLVLFIAPLLFNETREASPRELWRNRADIFSLAVGLVVVSVLVIGYALNRLVPAIPLAAAFALGGALGPTDAAAVTALRSSVNLTGRQRALLSGESLINDASGVMAFQFSVAAAVTGAFSLMDATASFTLLFVGGIALGAILGFVLSGAMRLLGRLGFEDVTSHALYELLSPFIVYLVCEDLGVSGILAVVAAGLVMTAPRPRFHSTYDARRRLVSNSLWAMISFLINGTIFVLLGMQLPLVVMPGLNGGLPAPQVIVAILLVAMASLGCRLVWVLALELVHRRKGEGLCGGRRGILRDALVTTIAGAKGAVTLSIVLTLPLTTAAGDPFPERSLLVTLAAGVILLTLLMADVSLPLLAPRPEDDGGHDGELREATIAVFEATTNELRRLAEDEALTEYLPALRLTLSRYELQLALERFISSGVEEENRAVEDEEARLQAETLESLHRRHLKVHSEQDWQRHLVALRGIRGSVGYTGRMADVIPNRGTLLASATTLVRRTFFPAGHRAKDDSDLDRIYGQSCIYAIELEYVSLEYFERVMKEGDVGQARAAHIRHDVHELALHSLWGRLNYGRDVPLDSRKAYTLPYDLLTHDFNPRFREQFSKAREFARDVDENALRIELDEIGRLQSEGTLTRKIANELRENVYLLQMGEG